MNTIHLQDRSSGSNAKITLDHGFNCYSWVVVDRGETFELLWANPVFETGTTRPAGNGIPILFPFAGRLRGKTLVYNGKSYPQPSDDRLGNAIHGLVLNRPWKLVEQSDTTATADFQASRDEPSLLAHWPADFKITATYRLAGPKLRLEIKIDNPSSGPLPFGLGTHGYYRVPLSPLLDAAERKECRLTVPAAKYWELEKMLPTGKLLPATGMRDLRNGAAIGDVKLDDVLTGLTANGNQIVTAIDDPKNKRSLQVRFDSAFRECVVFNPPHREAVCIEPYLSGPDAYNLEAQGIDTGLRTLATGESFVTWIEHELISQAK